MRIIGKLKPFEQEKYIDYSPTTKTATGLEKRPYKEGGSKWIEIIAETNGNLAGWRTNVETELHTHHFLATNKQIGNGITQIYPTKVVAKNEIELMLKLNQFLKKYNLFYGDGYLYSGRKSKIKTEEVESLDKALKAEHFKKRVRA